MKRIKIRTLKRIEGEAGLEIVIDGRGRVRRIEFKSDLFRGFERFCVGRPVEEMPFLASRICGICAEAHYLAALRALDQIFEAPPPTEVRRLRRIFFLAGFVRDHLTVLSLFALPDASSEKGDSLTLLKEKGILSEFLSARKDLATILEIVGGRRLHGGSGLPGGWRTTLEASRIELVKEIARQLRERIFSLGRIFWESFLQGSPPEERVFLPVHRERVLLALAPDFMEGELTALIKGASGAVGDYRSILGETLPQGEPLLRGGETYMVGPWARFRLWPPPGNPILRDLREKLFNCLKQLKGLSPSLSHLLRTYELLVAADELTREADSLEAYFPEEMEGLRPSRSEGVGMVEAPRGLLIHHYRVDEAGRVVWLRILTPTAQNLRALKEDLEEALKITTKISEEAIFFLEEIIRAYDPCVPCMLHLLKRIS